MNHRTLLLIVLMLSLAAGGCRNTIIPPARLESPVTVLVLDHGRTSSLLIPVSDERTVRFGYGDWDWYALRKTAFWRAVPALVWPTHGALGTAEFNGPADPRGIPRSLNVYVQHVYQLSVERQAACDLIAQLNSSFAARSDRRVSTPSAGFDFVQTPRDYWIFHNSNHLTAQWLRQLGAQVKGPAFFSNWQIKPPAAESTP